MIAPTLCLLLAIAQADPTEAKEPQPFLLEDDGYLRASDLGMKKYVVNADIGGDTVLSLIKVIRRDGKKDQTLQFEQVTWSQEPKRHQETILIFDTSFFFNDNPILGIKGMGTTDTFDLKPITFDLDADNVNMRWGGGPKSVPEVGEYRRIVTVRIHNKDNPDKMTMLLATRRAKLSDYPEAQKAATKASSHFTYGLKAVAGVSKELEKYLDGH